MSAEAPEIRLRRTGMRSWRRGTKEMDLILGRFADARLASLSEAELAAYERMLDENDNDLYLWVSGARAAPAEHAETLALVAAFHGIPR